MTKQQIFDHVVEFLMKQGRRSVGPDGCMYMHPDGSRCAIGCLPGFPERLSNASVGIDTLLRENPESVKPLLPTDTSARHGLVFLDGLQSMHDSLCIPRWKPLDGSTRELEPEEFRTALREAAAKFAAEFGVTYNG